MPDDPVQARIIVLTDGTLVSLLLKGPDIPDCAVLIIDEVHDLGLDIEFVLGRMKNVSRYLANRAVQ